MKENKVILKDQRILLLLVIFVIIFAVTVINPKFITIKNIVTILGQISVIGILTMAMSMLLISGGIDLSLGNIMALSSVVMAALLAMGQNIIIVIFGGIITGLICGLINGFIIAKSKCIPLIITLGTSQIFYGLSLTISKGRIMSFSGVFDVLSKTKFFHQFSRVFRSVTKSLLYFISSQIKFFPGNLATSPEKKFQSQVQISKTISFLFQK